MVNYFFDVGYFINKFAIIPISISLVSDDGHEYHVVSADYDSSDLEPWVMENVISPLYDREVGDSERYPKNVPSGFHKKFGKPMREIKKDIIRFVSSGGVFWGYHSSFEWVALHLILGDTSHEILPGSYSELASIETHPRILNTYDTVTRARTLHVMFRELGLHLD